MQRVPDPAQTWRDVARAATAAGDQLTLRRKAALWEIRCNGWQLMSSAAHHSEAEMARVVCTALPGPAPRVLIGGLGLGYTLRAALDALPPAARVAVVEYLPEIVEWNRGPLAPLAGRPLDDPRVSVIVAELGALLRCESPDRFDAILLDVDNGPDAVMLGGNEALYGAAMLGRIGRRLAPLGWLGVWAADPSPDFEAVLTQAGWAWRRDAVPARLEAAAALHAVYVAQPPAAATG